MDMLEYWMNVQMWACFDIDGHMDGFSEDTWTLYNNLFVTRNKKEMLAKLTNKCYDELMKSEHFRNLSMDEQGRVCVLHAKNRMKKLEKNS